MKKRIKYIKSFMHNYKVQFVEVALIIIVTTAIVAFYPYLFGKLIDSLFYDKNIKLFFKIVIIYLVIYLINQFLHYQLDMLVAKLGIKYSFDIKRSVIYKVLTYKSKDLSALNTGDVISRVNKDADEPLNFIYHDIFYGFSAVQDFLMCFSIIAYINVTLAIITLVMSVVAFALSKIFEMKLVPMYKNITKLTAKNSNWLFEVLNGMRDIKLISAVDKCFDQYMDTEYEVVESNSKIVKKEIVAERVNDGVKLLATLIIYLFAALFIIRNILTLGGLVACIDYFNRMMLMMDRIYSRIFRFSKRMVSIDRVIEIDEFDSEKRSVDDKHWNVKSGKIDYNKVSFSYTNEKKVLNQLDLHINAGEKIAIVGKSGEGKSTIAELMFGLYEYEGEILVDDKNIANIDVHELRGQIGIVNQKPTFFSNTIRFNLIFTNEDIYDQEIWRVLKLVEMDKVIKQLPEGLDTQLSTSNISLSGGQLQRLALVRAYLKKASIMIFDESTSAIDGCTEDTIVNSWYELFAKNTVIIIAHRFSTIMRCDRVAVLENGKIVAFDRHEELLKTSETYRKLFEKQSSYFVEEDID